VEVLEDRTVPTSSVQLSKGILSIIGTTGNDTASVQQLPASANQLAQIAVTLNGRTVTFKAASVAEIRAQLDTGDDTITLDESSVPVAPPLSFDGGGGLDAVIVRGTAAADVFTITATQVRLTGAGTLGYVNFDSLTVNTLGGNDTLAMTGINAATTTTADGGAGTRRCAWNSSRARSSPGPWRCSCSDDSSTGTRWKREVSPARVARLGPRSNTAARQILVPYLLVAVFSRPFARPSSCQSYWR